MNININIDKKILVGLILGGLIATTALFVQPSKAQAVTSLSGQYGCIMNRNFGGYVYKDRASTDLTGSNFMLYFDFTGNSVQLNVVGITNWGATSFSPAVTSATLTSGGVLSVVAGPLTNSFIATTNMTYGGSNGHTMNYYLMAVNGGTTLLLQSGTGGTDDGEPATGVCNKV
jgi:hypothetical protein